MGTRYGQLRQMGIDLASPRQEVGTASLTLIFSILYRHRGVAQLARVPALGAGGRAFESRRPDHEPEHHKPR